jgi:thiamine biosynthesis protein ThiI
MTEAPSPQSSGHEPGPARSDPGSGEARLALLRFSGELTLKASATRRRFVKRLVKNLKDALKSQQIKGRVIRDHNRLFIEAFGPGDLSQLAHCFGVQSVSIVEPRPWKTMDDLVAAGVELYGDAVAGKRFAVRARRVGDRNHTPVHSQEVARQLGAALNRRAAGVDLENPEVSVHVEIMADEAYFFPETIRGYGGLPLGTEGRAVSLVSGGFDSAVASWQLLKRGVSLDYAFCNLGGRDHQLGVLRVMKQISDRWSYGQRPHLHSIDFDLVTRDLRTNCEMRYWQVVLKRLMLRAGEAIARERDAAAIVTGEAVGQVSSQTLQNLAVISSATSVPILRPLVGFNKDEIIAIAREIGTEDLSKDVDEYCAMVPTRPATNAQLERVLAEEARLDPDLLERAVEERSLVDLRSLDLETMERPDLQTSAISPGATIIDLRSPAAFRAWHYPEALHLDFNNALRAYSQFDKRHRYVLYCEFGLKSAHLAELMCSGGYDAAHFGGGLSDLIDYARHQGLALPDFMSR